MSINQKPQSWQELPCGDEIQLALEQKLTDWWPRIFGYHLLKLGALSAQVSSLHCNIARHFSIHDAQGASIQADPHHLPLQTSTMDAVLMSFLMEFEHDPYRLLREVDRVMISGGYIFVCGFNPVSTAFMGKLLPKYQTQLPWCGQFFMPARVKDWLGLLGYQILQDERFIYHPLLGQMNQGRWWQNRLEKWLPGVGSVYLIVARKMESPLTPIREKRKARTRQWATAPTAGRAGHSKHSKVLSK
ncbi:class I SAM-dependent methyltransferase [Shewanella sp. UCD-KL21]|uniref:class I SAM-dependent methyltransferase n=1 Tax=Shewanella sp. UCD-KL21 TaxID=1917164 RepID=UPI000970B350|nr:methyltransferase domain-containing protein [Shewanella sp. UCD-KL21]